MHDYHLAQSMEQMAEHENEDSITKNAVDKVLEKYGLAQADLDSSLSYYAHHMIELKKIYDNINKRYTREAAELGIHRKMSVGSYSESGDTTDIWVDSRLAVLSTDPLNSMLKFRIDADSSFYQRDQFQLQGWAHFMVRPGQEQKNSIALGLTVLYENDSVQSSSRTITAGQDFMLDVRSDTLQNIKAVYGYMAVANNTTDPVLFENLKLFKMHRRHLLPKDDDDTETPDSVRTDSVEAVKADTLKLQEMPVRSATQDVPKKR